MSPTIVYVTSILIPPKPEEDDGEVWSCFGQGMLQDVALSSGSMYGEVQCPYKEKNSRFPALYTSEQWSHGCHGKDNNPEHLVCQERQQRRSINVNLVFVFFYVFTVKVRSRKTLQKKLTFLFDSVMFSKSRTVAIRVVVIITKGILSYLRFRIKVKCSTPKLI